MLKVYTFTNKAVAKAFMLGLGCANDGSIHSIELKSRETHSGWGNELEWEVQFIDETISDSNYLLND